MPGYAQAGGATNRHRAGPVQARLNPEPEAAQAGVAGTVSMSSGQEQRRQSQKYEESAAIGDRGDHHAGAYRRVAS